MKSLVLTVSVILVLLAQPAVGQNDDTEQAFGIESRTPWTGSRVIGSPDPPLPYIAVETFTQIDWDSPLYAKPQPGSNDLIVVQQGGEASRPSKLLRVVDRHDAAEVTTVLEVSDRLVYGIEFHPLFIDNGQIYVFSNGPTPQPERTNRISRYIAKINEDGQLICDPQSELVIIEWRSMGHDGGDLVFGHDGMLYATAGDGTSDSDNWLSAQDVRSLLGGVLRIDVDRPSNDRPYSIPPDNPFVEIPDARGELWAIGLRNPWRMSIDDQTGQIWVGNNGQDLWETVHLIRRGENYGWSVYEGSHSFYPNRDLGPGILTLPTLEHHHVEARSLTGGVVYNGDRFADLSGAYIYGDYSTGKIWAVRHDGTRVTSHREIADTAIQIVGFSNSHQGDLLVIDHGGGIFRLESNPQSGRGDNETFPRKLSESGIFASLRDHRVADGVIPYSVNAEGWHDGASIERFIAVPGQQQINHAATRGWNFPDESVLVQTLSLDLIEAGVAKRRRIETRILTRQQGEWAGYSYAWNRSQDDATLVERDGRDMTLQVADNDGSSRQITWRIPARAECMTCHSRAVNYVLGMTDLQMNREHDYGDVSDNQLRTLEHIGLLSAPEKKSDGNPAALVDPHGANATLQSRVKSYLHANCSSCHVQAGGGNARMDLEFVTPLPQMNIVSYFPQHDTFGIAQPTIVAPGDPDRSVMLARLSRRGRGQMPPLGSNRVDERGVALFKQWMSELKPEREFVKNWTLEDLSDQLPQVLSGRSFDGGRKAYQTAGCNQCHRLTDEKSGIGPNLDGISKRKQPEQILASIVDPSAEIAKEYAQTIIVTVDAVVIQGRVESETDDVIVLRGSASSAKPQTVSKADVEARSLSTVSAMPIGTINHLHRDQILDLLAYILADGDSSHPAFDSHSDESPAQ